LLRSKKQAAHSPSHHALLAPKKKKLPRPRAS
jgi:hypothetical protein